MYYYLGDTSCLNLFATSASLAYLRDRGLTPSDIGEQITAVAPTQSCGACCNTRKKHKTGWHYVKPGGASIGLFTGHVASAQQSVAQYSEYKTVWELTPWTSNRSDYVRHYTQKHKDFF